MNQGGRGIEAPCEVAREGGEPVTLDAEQGNAAEVQPVLRLPFVDALRGLAILGVMFVHAYAWSGAPGRGEWVNSFAASGARGVQLFFVVSAYTLMLSLDRRRHREARPIRNFWIRRVFRIVPMYYLALVTYNVLKAHGIVLWSIPPVTPSRIMSTATFTNWLTPEWSHGLVPGGWTISVEMTFYLMLPLLFFVVQSLRAAVVVTLVAVAVSTGTWVILWRVLPGTAVREDLIQAFIFHTVLRQLPIFCCGILLYYISYRAEITGTSLPQPSACRRRGVVSGLAALVLFLALAWRGVATELGFELYGLAFLLLGYSLSVYANPLVLNRFTCYVGTVSYSGYLLHFAVASQGRKLIDAWFAHLPISLSPHVRWGLLFVFVVVVTVAGASITYRLIELPVQRVGRRIIAALEARDRNRRQPAAARSESQTQAVRGPTNDAHGPSHDSR